MSGIVQSLLAGFGAAAAAVTDAYFNLVTLLLPGNGTNGAQNNTFLDSSSNAFSITRNGNTTQGTFSPFSQTGWGNYFNGSADYLTISSNAALQLMNVDWTVECWVYLTSLPASGGYQNIVQKGRAATSDFEYELAFTNASGTYKLYIEISANGSSTTGYSSSGISLTANTWNNITFCKSGSTIYYFFNGVAAGTSSIGSSTGWFTGTGTLGIAATNTGGTLLPGYVSNLRITKSGALYTSGFTPSTTPLTTTVSSGTVSLLTCQSNRFVDNSSNAFSITTNGSPSVQAFSPFAPTAAYDSSVVGGSGYFDGSTDYLSVADNTALQLTNTSVFTLEAWVYPSSVSAQQGIIVKRGSSGTQEWGLLLSSSGTAMFSGNTNNLIGTTALKANSWNHIAASSDGTTVSIFANGARDGTATATSLGITASTNAVLLGYQTTTTNPFTGYMASARLVKGTQLYSGTTYTIPTAPLTAVTNTSLLLNYTNAGITDATAKNDLETVGNAQISTTQSKFGGGSMYFDGTGDWLQIPNSNLISVDGTTPFTIEFWMYASSINPRACLLARNNGSTAAGSQFDVNIETTGQISTNFYSGSSAIQPVSATGVISTNTWTHVAITKDGSGNYKIFINGTQSGSTVTNTSSVNAPSLALTIGSTTTAGTNYYTGYIDDLRITKGYARYTANFTAPTAAFPVQ